jgi:hypothetical protein
VENNERIIAYQGENDADYDAENWHLRIWID